MDTVGKEDFARVKYDRIAGRLYEVTLDADAEEDPRGRIGRWMSTWLGRNIWRAVKERSQKKQVKESKFSSNMLFVCC